MKIKKEKFAMQTTATVIEEKADSPRFTALTKEEATAVAGGYPWIPGWLSENPFTPCGFDDCL